MPFPPRSSRAVPLKDDPMPNAIQEKLFLSRPMRDLIELSRTEQVPSPSGPIVLPASLPTPIPPPDFFTVHQADARTLDAILRPYSSPQAPLITCTITSPPYADLKNYGHRDQIGWGQSYDEYLAEMLRVFRAIARNTRDDGTLWVIADTLRPQNGAGSGLHALELLPFHLAEEARTAGWTLRDIIIWKKDRTLPWSGHGRLRNTFEYVLFFSKTDRFKYHVDRIRDPIQLEEWWVKYPERYNPAGKVPHNVWEIPIPTQGSWAKSQIRHACPLPVGLVERLILLSTDPGDVVFDPFAGSGVVVAGAESLDRRGIGIELEKRHVKAFQKVVRKDVTARVAIDELPAREARTAWLQEVVFKLRAVKYPRVLMSWLLQKRPDLPKPYLAISHLELESPVLKRPFGLMQVRTLMVVDGDDRLRRQIQEVLCDAAAHKPASKFGISGPIAVLSRRKAQETLGEQTFYRYPNGRTHMAEGTATIKDALASAAERAKWRHPLILSNVEVREQPRRLR
jgi:DNA modification methylase